MLSVLVQKLFTKSVKWGVTNKSYQAADIFDVHDEKLFSAMCKWSNHCLHRLLQSERNTGRDLRHSAYTFVIILALLGVVLLFACCMIHCKYL